MLKLIFKNVYKHKLLYLLIGIIVALLSFYLIIGMNSIYSISESLKKAISENMTGDVIIAPPQVKNLDVMTKSSEKELIPFDNWEAVLAFIRERKQVVNASPRLRVRGLVRSDYNNVSMILTGVDTASEKDLLPRRKLDDGVWIDGPNQINLYYRHADHLSASVGDTLGITLTTKSGYSRFDTAVLAGNFDYSDIDYYSEFAYYGFVTLDYLNSLLGTDRMTVSEIYVRLDHKKDVAALSKELYNRFGINYKMVLPQDSSKLVRGIYQLTHFIIYFVMVILLIMVFLCSSFIVNLSIETRRQEIGVYQAIGVYKWKIGLLFSGEFLIVMLFFGLLGALIALFVMQGVSVNGIKATIIPLHLVFGRSVLFIKNNLETYMITFLVLFLSFVGNVVNAVIQLGKLDPIEVMRDL